MRPKTLVILVGGAGLIGAGFFAALGGSAPATQPAPPITLKELDARGIEGRLGSPLGTVLSVSGHIIPNSSQAKADVDEAFFVCVEKVNDRRLDSPVAYPAREFPLKDHGNWKVGAAFSCTGYETGGFNDSVDDPSGQPFAHPGYGFVVRFHIFKMK